MTRKLSIVLLATLAALAFGSTAFAGNIGTEAGNYEFSFDQVTEVMVETPNYSSEYLAALGTEAGTWNIQHIDVNAQMAAEQHIYNWDHLHALGTEAGDFESMKLSDEPKRVCILC
ncbi:MAG: hypothetical protein C0624_04975 [Desulfuromonas sp.]|nr:MAG: hypothetical protein C0624_04975 [Desulfuromonas sp.]